MEIKVPTLISDITLEEYQKYALIDNGDTDEDFKMFKTIEIFCGVDISLVSKMSLKDVTDIYEEIQLVLTQDAKLETQIEVDGIKYGLIPEFEKISIGEYIDLEDGLKDVKNFHKAMAVLYRPIKKSYKNLYTIESYEGGLEALDRAKKFPLSVVTSVTVFFCNIEKELLQVIPHYSAKLQKKALDIREKNNLPQSTVGLLRFIR